MEHPFNLSLSTLKTLDLEFEDDLASAMASDLSGGLRYITRRGGEQGGVLSVRPPKPVPIDPVIPHPPVTTKAIGEEGGWQPPEVTTLALGEEGGWATTLALGEEGGWTEW